MRSASFYTYKVFGSTLRKHHILDCSRCNEKKLEVIHYYEITLCSEKYVPTDCIFNILEYTGTDSKYHLVIPGIFCRNKNKERIINVDKIR